MGWRLIPEDNKVSNTFSRLLGRGSRGAAVLVAALALSLVVPLSATASTSDDVDRSALLSGTVTGIPAASMDRITVQAESVSGPEVGRWTTDVAENGQFSVEVPPGEYVLWFAEMLVPQPTIAVQFYGGASKIQDARRISVSAGQKVSGLDVTLRPWTMPTATRLAGADRFETAAAMSRAAFSSTAKSAYLASGESWADALSAGPAASNDGGPLLLVRRDGLPPATSSELRRIKPAEVVIAGGPNAISSAVEASVRGLATQWGGRVTRISGDDRYGTSRALIDHSFGAQRDQYIFIATGRNYPDALTAASVASYSKRPLLLVDGTLTWPDEATFAFMRERNLGYNVIVGGPNAISTPLAQELARYFTQFSRNTVYAGSDRYATNRQVFARELSAPWVDSSTTYLASGESFADALAGGPLSAVHRGPIFLTPKECVPADSAAAIRDGIPVSLQVLGGENAVSNRAAALVTC